MKRTLITALFLAIITMAFAGPKRHYDIRFSEFNELKVTDGINVDYYYDPERAGLVEFDADETVASAVIFTPDKNKLKISLASRDSVYRNLPTIKVYSSFISSVRNEGDSTVRVISSAACPEIKARLIGNGRIVIRDCKTTRINLEIISGNGTIMATGTSSSAKYTVAGAGDIQADDLKAEDVSAVITGTGTIACFATKELSAGGLGSGKINYRGTPAIKTKFVSKVKLISIDANAN